MSYNIKYTNTNKTPIEVDDYDLDESSTDLDLYGYLALEYGEKINENLLHILENFACPENPSNPDTPNYSRAISDKLENPTEGQLWFNTTQKRFYFWSETLGKWRALQSNLDIEANFGSIAHGQRLPRPVSPITGSPYQYDECIWSVSPRGYSGKVSQMRCYTDNDANVTMQYIIEGESTPVNGVVNYLIVGIRGNNNQGATITPAPPFTTLTPTPTPSVTPSSGSSPTPTPTPSDESITPLLKINGNSGFTSIDAGGVTPERVYLQGEFTTNNVSGPYTYKYEYIGNDSESLHIPVGGSSATMGTVNNSSEVPTLQVDVYPNNTVAGTNDEGDWRFYVYTNSISSFDDNSYEVFNFPSTAPTPTSTSGVTPTPTPSTTATPGATPTPTPSVTPSSSQSNPLTVAYDPTTSKVAGFGFYSTEDDCVNNTANASTANNPITVEASGGSGNYTFQWNQVTPPSQGSIFVVGANQATPNYFTGSFPCTTGEYTYSATYTCTVDDGVDQVTTPPLTVEFTINIGA